MSRGVFIRVKDEKTWTKFKEYVLHKHGKLHGALGEEVTEAIRRYLESEEVGGLSPKGQGDPLR